MVLLMKRALLYFVFLVVLLLNGLVSCSVETGDIPPCSTSVPNSMSNSGLHAARAKDSDRWGFISTSGKFTVPPQFSRVTEFNEGLALAQVEQAWGVIDTQGKWQVSPHLHFGSVRAFCNGLAAVEESDSELWGFINTDGTLVIEPQYTWVSDFSEGRAFVKDDEVNPAFAVEGSYDLIDRQGQQITQLNHYDFDPMAPEWSFSHGRLGVRGAPDPKLVNAIDIIEGRIYWGFIDRSGHLAIPVQFKWVHPFSEGLAAVRTQDNRVGFIDVSGKMTISARFDNASSFSQGLAAVEVEHQWGYINQTGEVVIEPDYELVDEFSEGLAAVQLGDRWGFIDRAGSVVIAPQFEAASSFRGGLARVKVNEQKYYIDRQGQVIRELTD